MKRTYESESDNDDVSVEAAKVCTRWSSEEDALLRKLVQEYGGRINRPMAEAFQRDFPKRTQEAMQCRWGQYIKISRNPHWSAEEVDLLTRLVEVRGSDSWPEITAEFRRKFPDKSTRSIRAHWCAYINKNRDWTAEEETRLIEAQKVYGNKWTKIVTLFPNRDDQGIMYHFKRLQAKESKPLEGRRSPSKPAIVWNSWTPTERAVIMQGIAEGWTIQHIAGLLPNRTLSACTSYVHKMRSQCKRTSNPSVDECSSIQEAEWGEPGIDNGIDDGIDYGIDCGIDYGIDGGIDDGFDDVPVKTGQETKRWSIDGGIDDGFDDVPVKTGQQTKRWSSEEDELLRKLVDEYGSNKWGKLTKAFQKVFPDRTYGSVQKRWTERLNSKVHSRKKWSVEEDDMLEALVEKHGCDSWSTIVRQFKKTFPVKEGRELRVRWCRLLNQGIHMRDWTLEEEHRLIAAQKEHGNKWAKIQKLFPTRSYHNVRHHFLTMSTAGVLHAQNQQVQSPINAEEEYQSSLFPPVVTKGSDEAPQALSGMDDVPSMDDHAPPSVLPASEHIFPAFDMEGHDILADTEEVLYDFDVLPAAGASSLSDEYGLFGPD